MAHLPRLRGRAGLLAAVSIITLAGCGSQTGNASDDSDPVRDDPGETTSAAASETTSAPTSAASESEPTAEVSTTEVPGEDPAPAGLEGRLLTAAALPGVNEQTQWTVKATGPQGDTPYGECQRFDFVSLGATEAVLRTFTSNQDTVTAGQVVAEFADAKSAWRAHQVLKSWRSQCAERLKGKQRTVGDLTDVAVPAGFAQDYVLQYGDAGAEVQHFDGVGIARRGAFLSLVEIDLQGQDYNYPAGQRPSALAARAAVDRLG
jgi:hypothetical protein